MRDIPRVWSILLKVLPRSFRRSHEVDLREQIGEFRNDRSSARRRLALAQAGLDILWVGIRLRVAAVRQSLSAGGRTGPLAWVEAVGRDTAFAVRSLRRDGAVTAIGAVTVGLGIAASSTVFGVVHALLLRPLPFEEPERLVWISNGDWGRGQQLSELSVQVAHLQDIQSESRTIAAVGGYSLFDGAGDHTLMGETGPRRLTRLQVTGGLLKMLGVSPLIGRLFTEEELQWGGPPTVLLMHGFWERAFGSDQSVVGRTITIDTTSVLVVGVLPRSFDFTAMFAPGTRVDYVGPFPLSPETNRRGNTLALIGRLSAGATVRSAESELRGIASRPRSDRRNTFDPRVTPLSEHVTGGFRPALGVLSGAVGLVMLLVCANLSSLLLARGISRGREMAIRGALGAGRGRLVRQALTESMLVAIAGCAVGVALAIGGTRVVSGLDGSVPLLQHVRVDATVVAFTVVISVLAGLTFGIVPALRAASVAPGDTLQDGMRGTTEGGRSGRARRVLAVVEVAMTCLLLVGAGLMVRSFVRLLETDLGFEPANTLSLRIDPSVSFASAAAEHAYYSEALSLARAVPEVEAAGLTDVLPAGFNRRWCIRLPGEIIREGEPCTEPFIRVVSEGLAAAMGLTIVGGRDFRETDDRAAVPVAIVNESLARRFWPGRDPLGQTVAASYTGERTVIGVVRGTRFLSPEQEPGPELFLPIRQIGDGSSTHLIVRGAAAPGAMAAAVGQALRSLDASLPVNDVVAIEDIVDRVLSPRRFVVQLLASFGGFALVLACLGLYGVISLSVRQRERELAIRLALGASATEVRLRVLRETLRLALLGVIIGLPAAWAMSRALTGLLYEVKPGDPVAFVLAPATLLAVGALAGYLPSRRAARLDPAAALSVNR